MYGPPVLDTGAYTLNAKDIPAIIKRYDLVRGTIHTFDAEEKLVIREAVAQAASVYVKMQKDEGHNSPV